MLFLIENYFLFTVIDYDIVKELTGHQTRDMQGQFEGLGLRLIITQTVETPMSDLGPSTSDTWPSVSMS